MGINRVGIFNTKPINAPSIENNPLFEKSTKRSVESEKRLSSTLPENGNPKPGSKIDVTG